MTLSTRTLTESGTHLLATSGRHTEGRKMRPMMVDWLIGDLYKNSPPWAVI